MEPLDLCVRPHLCFECKQRFWTEVELEKHMNFIHRTKPSFVCIDCKCGFWTAIKLEKHMNFMHGTKSSVITRNSNSNQVSNFPNVPFYQDPSQQLKPSRDLSGQESVQVRDNKISPKNILYTLKSKRQKSLKNKRQKPYWPCSFFNTALNQLSQNSNVSSHKSLAQVSGNASSITSNILHKGIEGTNQIAKMSPLSQEPNQLLQNLKNSLKSGSVEVPENTTSNTKKVLQHLKLEETPNVNLPSFNKAFNKETNQNSQNLSDSLGTKFTQAPSKAVSTTEIILHSGVVGANLIPKIPSTPINEEQNQLLQNLKDSLQPKSVEVPDNNTSSTKKILQFEETQNISFPSFNEAFNKEANSHSQNSGDLLHTGLAQVPGKAYSASENNLHTGIAGTNQIPKTPTTPLNEEPNQLLQNLKNSLQPVLVDVPDNTTSSTNKVLQHLKLEETTNISLPSFNEAFNKERNHHHSLNTGLTEVPGEAATVSENILQNGNAGTNQILQTPSTPLNEEQNKSFKNLNDSLHPLSVQVPDNASSNTANILQPMNVEESQKLYSQNSPFSKKLNQLAQKSCVSINPRIAERPDNTSIKENLSPSLNFDESEKPFSQCGGFQNPSVSSPEISQEGKHATSTLANTLQSRIFKTNKTSNSQCALFNQRPHQQSQNLSDSMPLQSVSVQKSNNTTIYPRSILPLIVTDDHKFYSPIDPFNQGPNQLSGNSSVLLSPESVQKPNPTLSVPANISYMQVVGGNQIAYLPSIPFFQGPNQLLQNPNTSLILKDSGLVQVQDNKKMLSANNSCSWLVGNSHNISLQSDVFNQMPLQLLHNFNNSVEPNFVPGPDPSTTSKKKRVSKKRNVKKAVNNKNQIYYSKKCIEIVETGAYIIKS